MPEVPSEEQATPPAAEPILEDQIVDLDAEQAPEPAAKGAETVEAEDAKPETGDPDKTEPAEGSDEDKPSESKQRRTREKARVAAVMAENEALKRLVPDDPAQFLNAVEKEIGAPPKESEFADYLAFDRAMTVYEMRKANKGDELKQRAAQTAASQKQAEDEVLETFRDRADEARKTISDFDTVLAAATASPQNPEVIQLILSSEKAPELAYYLSKNAKTVNRLNEMSPLRAAAEIGRIEASLSTVAPKTVTKAPNPVAPLHGGIKPSSKDPDTMSFDEYKAYRKSGGGN